MTKIVRFFSALFVFLLLLTVCSPSVFAGDYDIYGVGLEDYRITPLEIPKVGSNTPVIDGVFNADEGWGEPLVHITEENIDEHLTHRGGTYTTTDVKGYYRWDSEYFYFCAVVGDEDHYNPNTGLSCWSGDSIRFDVKTSMYSADLNQNSKFWFALNNNGDSEFAQEWVEAGGNYEGYHGYHQYKVVNDPANGTTTYELACKWSLLMRSTHSIGEEFQFITAQRVMELTPWQSEPTQSVQLCGFNMDKNATKWFLATLVGALPESGDTPSGDTDVPSGDTDVPSGDTDTPDNDPQPETKPLPISLILGIAAGVLVLVGLVILFVKRRKNA